MSCSDEKRGRIYLARHCKTVWNLENRLQGSIDVPLSAEGRVQAQANVPKIEKLGIGRIISSPLKRARETAQIYADHLGVPVHISPELRELDHGIWEGEPNEELLHAPAYRRWLDAPASVPIPGSSENVAMAQRRLVEAIKDIALRDSDENVLVVTHKIIRAILQCALLDVDLRRFRSLIDESTDPIEIPPEQLQRICVLDLTEVRLT
jgi:broad specificity phosphatase PhoE